VGYSAEIANTALLPFDAVSSLMNVALGRPQL
jgi:hypothetical protein